MNNNCIQLSANSFWPKYALTALWAAQLQGQPRSTFSQLKEHLDKTWGISNGFLISGEALNLIVKVKRIPLSWMQQYIPVSHRIVAEHLQIETRTLMYRGHTHTNKVWSRSFGSNLLPFGWHESSFSVVVIGMGRFFRQHEARSYRTLTSTFGDSSETKNAGLPIQGMN